MRIQRTVSPVDGSVYLERALAGEAEIERILDRASEARKMWREWTLEDRQAVVQRFTDYMESHADEFAVPLAWQMGRPVRYGPMELRRGFAERARYMTGLAKSVLRTDVTGTDKEGFELGSTREPLGVVLIIAPWNYPYLTAVNSLVPALLAGNVVILKHSAQTPVVAEQFAEAFRAAGMPDGVYQFVHATHADVLRMVSDPRLHLVAFTGSVEGGRAVQKAAAEGFKRTVLELGGKDPAYVREDANLGFTIENVVDGAMFNSGQSCCAVERVYVHRSVYPKFVDGAVELTRQYKLGNPLDPETTLGPMVRTSAADFVRGQIAEAVSQGARTLLEWQDTPGSPYLAPQVLVDVHHGMRIMREETFGPAVGIMPVEDDAQAVELMNDSEYGLTASVWGTEVFHIRQIADQLDTGTVFMNRCDYLEPSIPWTGVKNSGNSSSNLSVYGFEPYVRRKAYHYRLRP
ncbi:MAG: aldehyde dehydrogenase family protein [Acidobacteria bacterium]|nr:aldehyde dehydrogenase family protein [Acidobacteriota bacterium]